MKGKGDGEGVLGSGIYQFIVKKCPENKSNK